jgi:formylglycine-generating enzyme required for sulfatase activity
MTGEHARRLAQLRQAYEGGFLDEDTYRTAVAALGAGPEVQAKSEGSGAIAQDGSVAAGEGGVAVRRDVLGDVLAAGARKEVHYHGPEGTDPPALRAAYLNRLFEMTHHLSLAGVDPKAASSEAEARLDLHAVYTALLTQSIEARGHPAVDTIPEQEKQRISVLTQLDRHPRLVLLGDPGSGKSTFVNFVTLCLAGEALGREQANLALLTAPLPDDEGRDEENPQPWSHGPLLPVRVILRDFAARGLPPAGEHAAAEHLWRFLADELEPAALGDYAPHLHRELLERGGLLLLDGLDEVPEADRRREQIKQAVQDFCATFRRCRILVTSRTYAYQQQEWQLPGFFAAVLAPFGAGQIRRFVERWYSHMAAVRGLHRDDAQGRAEVLKRAVFGSDRLQALAERPLLLTLMASLHAWRGGSLPERREELYADAVDLLLDWWESQRVVRDARGTVRVIQPSLAEWLKVDRAEVRSLLDELAYRAHSAQAEVVGTADVPEGELVSGLMRLSQNPEVNPARLVEYLTRRAGLLLPRGVGVYTFPHRTFQEYLAACHLTDHDYPDLVADLARGEPGRWREVALLAGAKAARGTASAIWLLVDALCYREPGAADTMAADSWGGLLAGRALLESADLTRVGERNRPKVERVRDWLVRILGQGDLPAVDRASAGRMLARLGDPRPEVMNVEAMQFCYVPPGPFWMGEGREEHLNEHVDYGYWMGRYPVTVAQFRAFVDAGGYGKQVYWPEAEEVGVWRQGRVQGWSDSEPRDYPVDYGEPFDLANHPAVGVTWYEALAYCRWLAERLRKDGLLAEGWTVYLPSEAEWEKAARGGLEIPGEPRITLVGTHHDVVLRPNPDPKRVHAWGDEADPNRANYDETGIGATIAAGCFPGGASAYGVEDLSGNVWEWTRSVYKSYPYSPADGRENPKAGIESSRVLRGGAFNSNQRLVRCACRGRHDPSYRNRDFGFRVVVAPVPSGLRPEGVP